MDLNSTRQPSTNLLYLAHMAIGDEPGKGKPQERQLPSEEKMVAALKAAESLPRISAAEMGKKAEQFGNNFYFLFLGRKFTPPGSLIRKMYLERAEAFGEPWQRFLSENVALLAEIDEVLAQREIVSELTGIAVDFYAARDFDKGDAFDKRVDPEIGISAVREPVWRKLNGLLQQAAEAMKKVGIEPSQFFG